MIEFGKNNKKVGESAPFLISAEESEFNRVKFVVSFSYTGEVGSKMQDTGVDALNNLLATASPLYPDESETYEIIFNRYILYQTRNESYCSWDDYEIKNGDYFIIFHRSRLLDVLPKITDCIQAEDGTFYPGEWKHFGIYCQNHVIDIISCDDPVIKKISRR